MYNICPIDKVWTVPGSDDYIYMVRWALTLFCSFSLPRNMIGTDENDTDFDWLDGRGPTSLELWTSVVNAICVSINNPQNGKKNN